MIMFEIRLKIVEFMLRKCHYQLIAHQKTKQGHLGATMGYVPDEEAKAHLIAITQKALESMDDFKDCYLAGVEAYLSQYEIDCKNFIKRLDPDYGKER